MITSDLDSLLEKATIALEKQEKSKRLELPKSKKPKILHPTANSSISTSSLYLRPSKSGTVKLTPSIALEVSDIASTHTSLSPSSVASSTSSSNAKSTLSSQHIKSKDNKETAGSKWFNLPATELTPEIERDLMLLKARNVLDPKRHYKKGTINEIPKYFQIGTIIAAPHEFYSSRIPKKDRKQHLIDELMADMESKKYYRKKFGEVMTKGRSGGKKWYKEMKEKRKKGWHVVPK